jgi:hypothetical protein
MTTPEQSGAGVYHNAVLNRYWLVIYFDKIYIETNPKYRETIAWPTEQALIQFPLILRTEGSPHAHTNSFTYLLA